MSEFGDRFRVGAVQLSPVLLDRDATLQKVVKAIERCGQEGVRLAVFPETVVPGYPYFAMLHAPVTIGDFAARLHAEAVDVPGPVTEAVADAVAGAGTVVVLGVNERDGGSLYNTQLVLDADGSLVGKRRKIMPTHQERMVWGWGDGSGLVAFDTAVGRVGALICWEHYMPLARYALMEAGEQIHCSHFPGSMFGEEMARQIDAAIRHHAMESGAFVVNSTSWLSEAQRNEMAPNPEVARNILNNKFYQNLSSAMAGSHEYLAMEKLYQLHLTGGYDLIVLDTPPTKHALDFLEAPNRVRAFFDRRISQWFVKPYLAMGRLGINLFNRNAATVLRLVERFTGAEFLHDVSEFVTGLADSFDIFRSRAEEVMHVLRGDQASFLLVTGTDRNALEEAAYFHDRIQEAALPFGGIIANRLHTVPFLERAGPGSANGPGHIGMGDLDEVVSTLHGEERLPLSVARKLAENYDRYQRLSQRDGDILREFVRRSSKPIPILTIPIFDEDIFDMDGLLKMNAYLFPPGQTH